MGGTFPEYRLDRLYISNLVMQESQDLNKISVFKVSNFKIKKILINQKIKVFGELRLN